ncbi:hypothetical protein [Ornithinimicrobium faecis]|uniref:DUF2975 domain-containing protein n=1 Tax=Ornithinimicrobium faecis TaxID=2934158 RepID=A0ABY4YSJ7_9MICO|nr:MULTISPECIES: hypothetical protein [unclassified Ornithinimicrobium]USQ79735.1 hypothetical protein NF556_19450 [Ornithinimicrobium sp. HY1793]
MRQKLKWWFVHLAAFVLGQLILLVMGASWPVALLTQEVPDPLSFGSEPAMWISRAWCVVFAIDTAWSLIQARNGSDDSTRTSDTTHQSA